MRIREKLNSGVQRIGNRVYKGLGDVLVTPVDEYVAKAGKAVAIATLTAVPIGCATTGLPSIDQEVLNRLNPENAATAPADPGNKPEEKRIIQTGYNALESTLTDEGQVRNRLLTNIDALVGPVKVGYNGLNEVNDLNANTYFGRHAFLVGKDGFPVRLCRVVKTTNQGTIDEKTGIRDTAIMGLLGGYGFIDVTADKDAANITAFYGRGLGKGFSIEVVQAVEMPFGGKGGPYTEIQLNKELGKRVSLFGRVEAADFDFGEGVYMIGIAVK